MARARRKRMYCIGMMPFEELGHRMGMSKIGAMRSLNGVVAKFVKALDPALTDREALELAGTVDSQRRVYALLEILFHSGEMGDKGLDLIHKQEDLKAADTLTTKEGKGS